ncbi:hypothetical protein GCM10028784_30250 [Myceligenerans cantabricum]
MDTNEALSFRQRAGTLALTIWYDGEDINEAGGFRRRYGLRIFDADQPDRVYEANDLRSGVGAEIDLIDTMRSLCSFLAAAADAYWATTSRPGVYSDNVRMFPDWLNEAAYLNSDEISMLGAELDLPDEVDPEAGFRAAIESNDDVTGPKPDDAAAPVRWFSVVFQQDGDADETLAIIDRDGVDAGIDHLAQWDFGDETEDAARMLGHVYDSPPSGSMDREHQRGDYLLSYNHALGHAGLIRRCTSPDSEPSTAAIDAGASTTQSVSTDEDPDLEQDSVESP